MLRYLFLIEQPLNLQTSALPKSIWNPTELAKITGKRYLDAEAKPTGRIYGVSKSDTYTAWVRQGIVFAKKKPSA